MASLTPDTSPLNCEVIIPDSATPLHDVISRWSDVGVERPAAVVIPNSEDDIVAAIRVAKENNLQLIPANGDHAPFVPIDSKTLYLDMKNFKEIKLDKASSTVQFGGGVTTGEILKALGAEGYYTLGPNSNSVGMVGCLLGGGSTALNGMHGFMVDHVVSIRLITVDGRTLDLDSSSNGEEPALYHALCGAGHGLGVITSVTMKAYQIAGLKMREDKVWTRRLTFPPTAVDIAAQTFLKLQPPAAPLTMVMTCLRSPPNSPAPAAPMIVLSGSYYGPSEEAEKATAPLFDPDVVGKTARAETTFIPFTSMNDALEPLNVHGGFKDISSCFLKTIDTETIKVSFERWLEIGNTYADAIPTCIVFGGWDTKKLIENGQTTEGQAKFFQVRDRGVIGMVLRWCKTPQTREAMSAYTEEMLAIYWRNEKESPRTLVNNMRIGMKLEELHTEGKNAELKRVKHVWDKGGVFWSPYGEE